MMADSSTNDATNSEKLPNSEKDDPVSSAASQHEDKNEEEQAIDEYPKGFAFLAIIGAVMLSTFLVAIDNVCAVSFRLVIHAPG